MDELAFSLGIMGIMLGYLTIKINLYGTIYNILMYLELKSRKISEVLLNCAAVITRDLTFYLMFNYGLLWSYLNLISNGSIIVQQCFYFLFNS
jgi:hypothetical protein